MLSLTCLWAVRQLAQPAAARPAAAARSALGQPAHRQWAPVLVACGMALISLWITATALLDRSRSLASGLADRLAPALAFGEAGSARLALQALQQLPEVQRAWLTRFDGEALAAYAAQAQPLQPADAATVAARTVIATGADSATCPAATAAPRWALQLDHLLLRQPVRFQGVPVGSLCLRIALTDLYRQAALTGAAGLLLCGLASLLGDHRRPAGGPA